MIKKNFEYRIRARDKALLRKFIVFLTFSYTSLNEISFTWVTFYAEPNNDIEQT